MHTSIASRCGHCWLVFAFITLIPALAFAEPGERRLFGKGNPFTADELPAGKLKEQIQALDPQARGKAMKWLHSFQFSASDAATHLRVDRQGGVFYTCPGDHKGCKDCKNGNHQQSIASPHDSAVAQPLDGSSEAIVEEAGEATGGETAPPETGNAPVPVTSPPVYSSKPGAPYHIYLDFNGAYVTGKAWTEGAHTTWDCYAWSTDGDYTTFSDSEQTGIRRIWERIAEDYAPFDVNVTTDATYDPDTYTGDKNKVGWLLITQTTDKNGNPCPHTGSGGVAYVGVFGRSDFFSRYQPAWVTPMGEANTAEAASHEMGHNMGLSHDTTTTNTGGYYNGHGTGDTSWGPIMGTGYGRNVSQWTKGEYYNYYNTQSNDDDLAVITTKVPYRTDDHGDTIGAASLITPLADGSLDQMGVIETTSDPDVFQFSTGAGSITINANPYKCDSGTFGGNLDIILELYDGGGTFITSSNPAANTYASITTTVTAGNYYIIVKPTGVGTPTASSPTGYTVYGSLGQYTITGNVILPGVSVTESGGTNVTEGLVGDDSYTLKLGTQPSADVVVTITPDSQLTVDKSQVTFTSSNWNTPQTVTITADDDSLEEGTHTGTITHTAASADGAFDGIDVGSVIATIIDNDDIVVTSPNGGESYYADTTQTIQWNSLMGGNVKIELLKGGSATTIVASTTNNGSYNWTIPRFQAAAGDYRIRITSVETPSRTDVSDGFFTIIEAPIYFSDLETNPSYTVNGTGWVRGAPTLYSALSGTQVFATNLTGTSWATSELTSAAIDCSNYTNVQLEYFMWALLRNDTGTYPGSFTGKVEVSNTGTDWGNVAGKSKILFQQTGMNTNWVQYNYDISDIADNQSTVYIRWSQINNNTGSYQTTNGGIGLEDIKLTGTYSSPVNTYTVTYNGNTSDGGSAPVDTAEYEQGATVTVLSNDGGFTKTGYRFVRWDTQANGNGSSYAANDTFTIGAADVTLYAIWTPAYSVTYNGNGNDGGAVPVDSNTYLPGEDATILDNAGNLTKTGFTFGGWQASAGGGTQYSPGGTLNMGSANVTLYARWVEVPTYAVTFYGNTNSGGDPPSQTKTQGIDLIIAGPGTLVKTGYDFVSWNTQADGNGQTYLEGATYSTDAALTLYAQWDVSTYRITYSGNGQTGGSAPANQTKIYGENITISDSGTLVRFGYTFDSWNTEPNGSGDTYAEGAVYSVNANLDLFAQWTPNTYTVTYVGNGNTGGSVPANQTKTHDVGLTLATAGSLVRTNTSFSGWNTAADGSGEAYAGGATYSGNTDITLYAQWSQSVVVLTEDFESPASITAYVELQLPDNGNWVAANDGSNGTKEHQHGMTDKLGGDFVAADPNHQAYSFRGADSGITTVAGAIGTLSEGSTYSVDFDLIPMDGSGNKILTDYRVQLIAFASGAARNDCSALPSGSLLLKEVSGTLDGPVSLSYTTGEVSDSSYMGYDIGLRFIGSGSSGVIDDISVEVGSLAPPGDPFDNWTGGGGGSGFSGDDNGDGIPDGLAWAMGANGPSSNAHGLMPVVDNESEAGFMIFNYRRLDAANEDSKTNFAVEYGTTLGSWTTATHDGTNTIIQSQDNYYGDGVDRVQVKLKRSAHGSGGKLFSRLKVTRTP